MHKSVQCIVRKSGNPQHLSAEHWDRGANAKNSGMLSLLSLKDEIIQVFLCWA